MSDSSSSSSRSCPSSIGCYEQISCERLLIFCLLSLMQSICIKQYVHMHARTLMKRTTCSAPFENVPYPADIAGWNSDLEPACTADNFRLDLNSPPKSPWNKSATAVFVRSFLDMGIFPGATATQVEKAFVTHLRGLSRQFHSQHLSQEMRISSLKKAKRAERKRNVSLIHGWYQLLQP
jgi:hypothetical protein